MRAIALALTFLAAPAMAGEADIIDAKATVMEGDQWRVDATVQHADTGWDHYANAFVVLSLDGTELETRILYHPHVHEQPFTRSVVVTIPADQDAVVVRAVDSVHETGGAEFTLTLAR